MFRHPPGMLLPSHRCSINKKAARRRLERKHMSAINKYHINLLSFNLLNEVGKRIYYFQRIKACLPEYTCKFVVYLDKDFASTLNNGKGYFYSSVSTADESNRPLIFQQIDFSINQITKSGLVEITFKLTIPTHYKDFDPTVNLSKKIIKYPKNKVRLRLSFSNCDIREPSFYQSLNDGTFLNTVIPIKEATNERSNTAI